jgi:predicted porin
MNKICKLSAIALLASSTSLMAQSKSFEGVSLGLSASAIGVEVSGSSTNTAGSSGTGSLGKVAEIAAIDLSYGYAIGPKGIIQVGASYTPGKAKAGSGNFTDNQGAGNSSGSVNIEVKDPYTIYIAPTYVVSKDSAIYFKVAYAHADTNASSSGNALLSKKPGDLDGISYGIGSKTMLTPNLYLGVEANITDYDSVTATTTQGTEDVGNSSARTVKADIQTVQGLITLGYKF